MSRLVRQCSVHPKELPWHIECPYCQNAEFRAEIEQSREALEFALEAPGEIQKIMGHHNLRITDLDDPMQKLAFTIYTKLVAVSDRANRALGPTMSNNIIGKCSSCRFDIVKGEPYDIIDTFIRHRPQERCLSLLRDEIERLRVLVGAIHESIGEDDASDDESLPEVIRQMFCEMRQHIERMENPSPCVWFYDDLHDVYESSCGAAWCMIEGDAEDNGVKFCQSCGHPVQIVYPERESDDE
jgi:hypothetical protein